MTAAQGGSPITPQATNCVPVTKTRLVFVTSQHANQMNTRFGWHCSYCVGDSKLYASLDNMLNCKNHIAKKRKQMDLRHKGLQWLLGRTPHLSVGNKLLLYKSIITTIWTYGIELWCCACKSNIAVIQGRQSKILRATVDAPCYINNDMIHKDLGVPTLHKVIHDRSIKHRTKLESLSNPLLQLLPRDNVIRRLKRRWPADL
jgi:hypothetical protein